MNEPTSLGAYLKRERERRGLALRTISESTKVSVALLQGLEADDISRWPGGIFRRAFVRSYAQCVGLDPDDVVRRFEEQHQPPEPAASTSHPFGAVLNTPEPVATPAVEMLAAPGMADLPRRARMIGTAADLTVAIVLAFGSAAAGSRLLWPVLLISVYYAVGVLLTGTSPMVALLSDQAEPRRVQPPAQEPASAPGARQAQAVERRLQPRRTNERPRQRRGAQTRVSTS